VYITLISRHEAGGASERANEHRSSAKAILVFFPRFLPFSYLFSLSLSLSLCLSLFPSLLLSFFVRSPIITERPARSRGSIRSSVQLVARGSRSEHRADFTHRGGEGERDDSRASDFPRSRTVPLARRSSALVLSFYSLLTKLYRRSPHLSLSRSLSLASGRMPPPRCCLPFARARILFDVNSVHY